MSVPRQPFAIEMRKHQLQWALDDPDRRSALRDRKGELSWVLQEQHKKLNMFQSDWWKHIEGSEHRWAAALNSSQCFGINLFGPLAGNKRLARQILQQLLPRRGIGPEDEVAVCFEHTPQGAAQWLGEKGQATQVDVFFEIRRAERAFGFVLVEVKLTETGFGSCRGWNGKHKVKDRKGSAGWLNPRRTRCENVTELIKSPKTNCWLVEKEGRTYWTALADPSSTLRMERVGHGNACPFRHGLYQLMRNRVLADELTRKLPGTWAEFAVCHHPDNDALSGLEEPVAGSSNALQAFRSLSSPDAVRDWNAREVVDLVGEADSKLADWRDWMLRRYFPT